MSQLTTADLDGFSHESIIASTGGTVKIVMHTRIEEEDTITTFLVTKDKVVKKATHSLDEAVSNYNNLL